MALLRVERLRGDPLVTVTVWFAGLACVPPSREESRKRADAQLAATCARHGLRSGDFFKQSTKYWPEGNAWLFDYKERSGGEKEILVYVTRRGIEVNTWQLAP